MLKYHYINGFSRMIFIKRNDILLKKLLRKSVYNSINYISVGNNFLTLNFNKKIKEQISIRYSEKVKEDIKKSAEVIDVWDGITLIELSIALSRPLSLLREVMTSLDIKYLRSSKDAKNIAKFFNFKVNIIKNPETIEKRKKVDIEKQMRSLMVKGRAVSVRPPVVTIMGHVDHGKTTLLDSLRESEIVKSEHGGITQHIGAFVVSLSDDKNTSKITELVTFLDTPGHKAFSAMRERGAHITDIVVLVVAADDGVMEQTIESISFANACNVPIIVAINKIDKVNDLSKSLEHLKRGLSAQGLLLEEEGGEVQAIRMSALKGIGLKELKESILALAETLQLESYTDGSVEAVVLESSVDQHRGKLATVLVKNGTLKKGDLIIAGKHSWAKVRSMFDEWGQVVQNCMPGYPVQVIGWRDDHIPDAGDNVWQLQNEKQIKEIMDIVKTHERQLKAEIDAEAATHKLEEHLKLYKPQLEARRAAGIRYKRKKNTGPREKMISHEGEENKVNAVVKCDVNGSLEVLLQIFESYPNDKSSAQLELLHYGIGSVTENDVELAACFHNGIIYAFNTGPVNSQVTKLAKDLGVRIKRFNVIYHLTDDLKNEISERLPLVDEENVFGEAVVVQEFVVNDRHKKVPVAGSRCSKGVLKRSDCLYKVIRNSEVIASGLKVSSLRHLKDEVESIKKDVECGIRFEGIQGLDGIRFQNSDVLVCYEVKKIKQKTKWIPTGFD